MAQETLNRIRETELKAKQQVESAKTSADEMLEKARKEVSSYKEELLASARADAKKTGPSGDFVLSVRAILSTINFYNIFSGGGKSKSKL